MHRIFVHIMLPCNGRARCVCVCVHVCALLLLSIFLVFEWFLALCFIEFLMFYC